MKKSRAPKLAEPPRYYRSNRKLRRRAVEKFDNTNNIVTARRVTLLPGFLRSGVKSETVRKSSESIEQSYDDDVLKENLHGLLREDKPPRRSTRLSGGSKTAADYFLEALSEPSPNRSKSIFREIKEKYAQKVEQQVNRDFGARIFARLGSNFALKKSEDLKREIANEVAVINDILAGKLDPRDMSLNRKRAFCGEEDKENYPLKFSYVPPTKWVFQTPPNRKLNFSQAKADDTCIKPAIVENCKEGKVVYEVNNKINVDFSRFSNRQEIDIDKRYMVEVANMAGPSEDFTFQIHQDDEDMEEVGEKKFQLRNDYYELENHFLSLTCRPKKAPCTVSRVPGLKRKRDIFEPEAGCSTDLETVHEFDSSFTFINNNLSSLEESFTFKFTANDGATTGHLFDFDGNKKDTFNFHY